tara:strand:- start:1890 stop:2648 length:759 start_codon:yes stop_codon:yes gene_type:complete
MRALLVGSLAVAAMLASACGADVSARPRASVEGFRQALATGDAQVVCQWLRYPLRRPYPLPPVASEQDCIECFDELFPKHLIDEVAASNDDDWQRVGWRGIMLGSGRLWLDDEQRLIGHNEHSPTENARRLGLIERDRSQLAKSLQGHVEPETRWQTKTYRVRIDRMPDDGLRYTSWRRDAPLDAAPDLELHNGVCEFQGSGGNMHYEWRRGKHTYRCVQTPLGGPDSLPLELEVRRGEDVLLTEAAVVFYP